MSNKGYRFAQAILSVGLHERFSRMGQRLGISKCELIQEAIELFLKSQKARENQTPQETEN